jgi:hypothetical protein
MREGFMILTVTSVPLYCRVSLDKPKMMKKAKGFVCESHTFQDIKKPDGFFGIHAHSTGSPRRFNTKLRALEKS